MNVTGQRFSGVTELNPLSGISIDTTPNLSTKVSRQLKSGGWSVAAGAIMRQPNRGA